MYGDDNWHLKFGEAESGGVRARFINSIMLQGVDTRGNDRDVEISVQLIGDPDYGVNPIPPLPLGRSKFTLDTYILAGGTAQGGPRETCQPGPGSGGSLERFTLGHSSTLTICGEDLLQAGESCDDNDECCSNECDAMACASF